MSVLARVSYKARHVNILAPMNIENEIVGIEHRLRQHMPNTSNSFDPISLLRRHAEAGDHDFWLAELIQLRFFCDWLERLRSRRSEVYRELVSRLRTCGQADNYFSLRMEARMAASLAKKNVTFALQERPDLQVDGGLGIECASAWPHDGKERDPRLSVLSAIRKKARKGYATPRTAVAVEITRVMAHLLDRRAVGDQSDFTAFLTSELRQSGFGSALLMSTAEFEDGVRSIYRRVDLAGIDADLDDADLESFMNAHFPFGDLRARVKFIPGQRGGVDSRMRFTQVPKPGEPVRWPLRPYAFPFRGNR